MFLASAFEVQYSTGGFFGEVADEHPLEPILVLVMASLTLIATTVLMFEAEWRLIAIRAQILAVIAMVLLVTLLGKGIEELWRGLFIQTGTGALALLVWRRKEAIVWITATVALSSWVAVLINSS